MGRDRCIFCDRFIFDGDDVTRPPSLGLTVHRHCYRREAGLEETERPHPRWKDSEDSEDSDNSEEPRW